MAFALALDTLPIPLGSEVRDLQPHNFQSDVILSKANDLQSVCSTITGAVSMAQSGVCLASSSPPKSHC